MSHVSAARDKCELLTMAGPPHPPTVAGMDSLIQLEYIIERERSRATSRQCVPANDVHITTSNPAVEGLRRMLNLLSTVRTALRYA